METFNEIINGEQPVLVDFYAAWCGPCQSLAPVIEELGREVQGFARVLKIDIDKNQSLVKKFHIQSVPTLIILKKGIIYWKHFGYADKSTLLNEINKVK
ncbi:MAG: thioredoxin [Bacteroidales bacterium]|nr:thioredoxin [Bacteroidales bacterium]